MVITIPRDVAIFASFEERTKANLWSDLRSESSPKSDVDLVGEDVNGGRVLLFEDQPVDVSIVKDEQLGLTRRDHTLGVRIQPGYQLQGTFQTINRLNL